MKTLRDQCRRLPCPALSAALAGLSGITLIVLYAVPLMAGEIYRTVDEDGNTVFTDQPPSDDARPEELQGITTIESEPVERAPDTGQDSSMAEEQDPEAAYEGLRIVFPPAEEATRRVTGEVTVRVEVDPQGTPIAEGHRLRVHVDGEPAGESGGKEVRVGPLNPGPHRLQARLVGGDGGAIVESSEITFYLIRQTVSD